MHATLPAPVAMLPHSRRTRSKVAHPSSALLPLPDPAQATAPLASLAPTRIASAALSSAACSTRRRTVPSTPAPRRIAARPFLLLGDHIPRQYSIRAALF